MSFYTNTDLDNDIQYIKELIGRYGNSCKNLSTDFASINKAVNVRICFISSQFKNLLTSI